MTARIFGWVTVEIAVMTLSGLFLMGSTWQVLATDIEKANAQGVQAKEQVKVLRQEVTQAKETMRKLEITAATNSVSLENVQDSLRALELTQTRILNILERRYTDG